MEPGAGQPIPANRARSGRAGEVGGFPPPAVAYFLTWLDRPAAAQASAGVVSEHCLGHAKQAAPRLPWGCKERRRTGSCQDGSAIRFSKASSNSASGIASRRSRTAFSAWAMWVARSGKAASWAASSKSL